MFPLPVSADVVPAPRQRNRHRRQHASPTLVAVGTAVDSSSPSIAEPGPSDEQDGSDVDIIEFNGADDQCDSPGAEATFVEYSVVSSDRGQNRVNDRDRDDRSILSRTPSDITKYSATTEESYPAPVHVLEAAKDTDNRSEEMGQASVVTGNGSAPSGTGGIPAPEGTGGSDSRAAAQTGEDGRPAEEVSEARLPDIHTTVTETGQTDTADEGETRQMDESDET